MVDPMLIDDRPHPEDLAALGMTDVEFKQMMADADEKTRIAEETEPRAIAARYDRESDRFVVDLNNGTTFIFPASLCQGLAGANPDLLAEIEIVPGGDGFHWEKLDNDFSLMGLMMGSFGGKTWMARIRSEIGRHAASFTSPARAAAARENGKKGGRPRKQA